MAKFRKGQSGNPSGKPKGCRNATTILFDELLKANAKELIEKAIQMAKDGDVPASIDSRLLARIGRFGLIFRK